MLQCRDEIEPTAVVYFVAWPPFWAPINEHTPDEQHPAKIPRHEHILCMFDIASCTTTLDYRAASA